MNPKRKLHVVDDTDSGKDTRPAWRSDAEREGLPLATTTDGKGAPKLPEHGHEALERLIGKRA